MFPAIEVSGTVALRGGGGGGLKLEGLYAELVWILRFEDCWVGGIEENVRTILWQGLQNRELNPGNEVMGDKILCALMLWKVCDVLRWHKEFDESPKLGRQ